MIFDNAAVTALYREYLATGDETLINRICELSVSLIEVVAVSVSPEHADDLAQEGHIKLYNVVTRRGFDPDRGTTLFSFLNTVLRNVMVDYLRKERPSSELCEDLAGSDSCTSDQLPLDLDALAIYAAARFPSLHSTVAADAATYVAAALAECKSRGVLRTLEIFYNLNRKQAYTFYHAITIYLRMLMMDKPPQAQLERVVCNGEMTLVPELYLVLGVDYATMLARIMGGSYVRF